MLYPVGGVLHHYLWEWTDQKVDGHSYYVGVPWAVGIVSFYGSGVSLLLLAMSIPLAATLIEIDHFSKEYLSNDALPVDGKFEKIGIELRLMSKRLDNLWSGGCGCGGQPWYFTLFVSFLLAIIGAASFAWNTLITDYKLGHKLEEHTLELSLFFGGSILGLMTLWDLTQLTERAQKITKRLGEAAWAKDRVQNMQPSEFQAYHALLQYCDTVHPVVVKLWAIGPVTRQMVVKQAIVILGLLPSAYHLYHKLDEIANADERTTTTGPTHT